MLIANFFFCVKLKMLFMITSIGIFTLFKNYDSLFFYCKIFVNKYFLYSKKLRLIYKAFYWHWRRRKRKVITWHGNTSVKPVPLAARAFKRALVPYLILIFWILYPKLVSALLETRSFFIKIEMTGIYFRAFLP